jgi:hypothetical protein
MKNILTIILAFLALLCKSQTLSLEEAAQCRDNPNCPRNFTYVKDVNNTLNKYVGIWKGNYNGRIYEMRFNKNLYEDVMGVKKDEIVGRLKIFISGNQSNIVFDNFNELDDSKTRFSGLGLTSDLQGYRMIFGGSSPEGCINYGTVSLRIDPNTPNQMKIKYWSNNDIVVGECPSTFSQTFPEQQEIFLTRQ